MAEASICFMEYQVYHSVVTTQISVNAAEVRAEAHHVERQFDGHVVTRQVGGPQETGLAELDGCREKAVQRKPDRHLQHNRQTAAERVHLVLAVHFHGFHRHGLLVVAVLFLEQFLNLGLQCRHFRLAVHHAVRQGIKQQFYDQREHQDHDTLRCR
jgi:hypothetical protein